MLRLAGMDKVDVRKNIAYDGERKLDFYRPRNAATVPLVIFLNGVGRPRSEGVGAVHVVAAARRRARHGRDHVRDDRRRRRAADRGAAALREATCGRAEDRSEAHRDLVLLRKRRALGTSLLASPDDFRAAVFYYGLMETAPKNIVTPVFVTRAGLDALAAQRRPSTAGSAQAVALDAPVTLITYPEGPARRSTWTTTRRSRGRSSRRPSTSSSSTSRPPRRPAKSR